jgi:phosphoglycolate phosphatase
MPAPVKNDIALFVMDIDNTLFDWVRYYVTAFSAMLRFIEKEIGVPYATLAEEAKLVFVEHGSIEYPFLAQELPSVVNHFGDDIDRMLATLVRPARDAFLAASEGTLVPYSGVVDTLTEIKAKYPKIPLVALTDAPRYVAMWKLNKLNLLASFDAVYGLADPRLPTSPSLGRVKVDPEILLKHLRQNNFGFKGKIRILPDEYEKPGTRGLKTVIMDFELDENPDLRQKVLWAGDNQRKDIGLGKRLGVKTAWASYGRPDPDFLQRLSAFSPPLNIHKNAALPSEEAKLIMPDVELKTFADILTFFP